MTKKLTEKQKAYQQQYGLLFGSFFAAFIALVWTGLLGSYLSGAGEAVVVTFCVIASILLFAQGLYLRKRYPLLKRVKLPYMSSGGFWAMFYGVIAIEVVILYFIIQWLEHRGLNNAVIPLIVFVVGVHFFPLAKLNGNDVWYVAATVLCVAMIAVATIIPISTTTEIFGAPDSSSWSVAAAIIMVATMLVTSAVSAWLYRRNAIEG